MKVLICAYACLQDPDRRFRNGGEGILGWNIVRQLGRFHQIRVLTHSQNRVGIETALKKDPFPNVEFYYLDLPIYLRFLQRLSGGIQFYAYLWQIRAYFFARKLHKKFHFDVFHHVTYANDWMASFIGAFLPIPYIRGPGGGAHQTPKKFLSEYSFSQRFWENIRSLGQWIFRHDPFFIIGQQRARAILVCNQEALKIIPKQLKNKAHLFPVNGVSEKDLDLLSSNEKKIDNKKFSVLTAGKLLQIKGFSLAIKTFKIFADKIPEVELIIIGDGPEFWNLKKLVYNLGIEKKVFFQGWLPREELLRRMLSSDLFLFPSLRDGGGAVVVEAMASSLPVVCLDIGGPGLHIDEKCGIKIEPSSPEQAIQDMVEALKNLYLNKELKLKLGRAAREKAEKEYSWDRLGERLSKIYKEVFKD